MIREISPMHGRDVYDGKGEQGSALIIATLVTVILALLGLSYLMMAQTESTIAENERNAATAMYVAEAGARLVTGWFNDPTSTGYLVPTVGNVDRALRVFDNDANPGTARVQGVSGDATRPIYKDSTLTTSPIFDRPYRSALANTFLGVETGADASFPTAGPDLVVSAAHLTTINNTLFPNFPKPDLRARISRIEVYGPPSASIGGALTRLGVATIKVTAGVFMYPGTVNERQIATRVVKAVVNEIPVPGPVGPLQSCSNLGYTGSFEIHWGTGSALAAADLPSNLNSKVPTGLPYALNDPGTYYTDATPHNLATWAADAAINNNPIEDPWFKFISGGSITSLSPATSNPQPYPVSPYPGDGTTSHSNIFQNTVINCPAFDYNLWKSIAQGGNRGNYYYTYGSSNPGTNTTTYKLDGTGTAETFAAATSGKSGIFFFDTRDGQPPRGLYSDTYPTTNLTPGTSINSSDNWDGLVGFAYLNTATFQTTGSGGMGVLRTLIPPGEPIDGSGFVNLQYPGTLTGTYIVRNGAVAGGSYYDTATTTRYCTDADVCTAGTYSPSTTGPKYDPIGLPFQTTTVLDGVMYNSGTFTASGNAVYFGSFVAQQGVLDGSGDPGFYFDESLVKGNWPRKGMNMPRVIISSWQTGL
jgi:Tfp pilus assembly protein PilX